MMESHKRDGWTNERNWSIRQRFELIDEIRSIVSKGCAVPERKVRAIIYEIESIISYKPVRFWQTQKDGKCAMLTAPWSLTHQNWLSCQHRTIPRGRSLWVSLHCLLCHCFPQDRQSLNLLVRSSTAGISVLRLSFSDKKSSRRARVAVFNTGGDPEWGAPILIMLRYIGNSNSFGLILKLRRKAIFDDKVRSVK